MMHPTTEHKPLRITIPNINAIKQGPVSNHLEDSDEYGQYKSGLKALSLTAAVVDAGVMLAGVACIPCTGVAFLAGTVAFINDPTLEGAALLAGPLSVIKGFEALAGAEKIAEQTARVIAGHINTYTFNMFDMVHQAIEEQEHDHAPSSP